MPNFNPAHARAYAIAAVEAIRASKTLRESKGWRYYFMRHPISDKRMWRLHLRLWYLRKRGRV